MLAEPSRRAVLGTGLAALAGCAGIGATPGIALGGVVVVNRRGEPLSVDLRIARDGTTVHDEGYEFDARPPNDGVGIAGDWSLDPAVYEVTVDVDGESPKRNQYDGEHARGDCTIAYVGLRETTVYWARHPGDGQLGCPGGTDG